MLNREEEIDKLKKAGKDKIKGIAGELRGIKDELESINYAIRDIKQETTSQLAILKSDVAFIRVKICEISLHLCKQKGEENENERR